MKTQLDEIVNLVRLARVIDHAGLTLKDYLAMSAMPANMTTLAKAVGYTTAAATGHVDRMSRDGLVQRDPQSSIIGERRDRIVRLTTRGTKVLNDIEQAALA